MKNLSINNISKISEKAAAKLLIKEAEKINFRQKNELKKNTELKKIRKKAVIYSGILGASGVFILFLPSHIFPNLFPEFPLKIPFTETVYQYSPAELIYSVFLVAIELWLLIKNDIKNVGKIAKLYNINISANEKYFNQNTKELVQISLGKDKQKFAEVGINPYQNISKTGIIIIRSLYKIKAFLSNFALRILIKKLLGRIAVRSVTDFAGIPIYAFWNAYAASILIRKANMRMLADTLMNKTGNYFVKNFKNNKQFTELIYDTLEFTAITKKNFYPADFLFAKHILNKFDIKIIKEHKLSENYIEKIKSADKNVKTGIAKMMIIAFIIDGNFGALEKRTVNKLIQNNVIPFSLDQISNWAQNYKKGKGIDIIFNS